MGNRSVRGGMVPVVVDMRAYLPSPIRRRRAWSRPLTGPAAALRGHDDREGGLDVGEAGHGAVRRHDRRSGPAGPTVPQHTLLGALSGGEPTPVSSLASVCGNMRQVLSHCVSHGWAETFRDPATGETMALRTRGGDAALQMTPTRKGHGSRPAAHQPAS